MFTPLSPTNKKSGGGGGGGRTLLAYLQDNTSQTTASATPVNLPNMDTGAIATNGGIVSIRFDCDVSLNGGNSDGGDFFILVDGAVKAGKVARVSGAGVTYLPVSLSCVVQGLAAGNHTFKVQWNRESAGSIATNSYGDSNTPTILEVWEG